MSETPTTGLEAAIKRLEEDGEVNEADFLLILRFLDVLHDRLNLNDEFGNLIKGMTAVGLMGHFDDIVYTGEEIIRELQITESRIPQRVTENTEPSNE